MYFIYKIIFFFLNLTEIRSKFSFYEDNFSVYRFKKNKKKTMLYLKKKKKKNNIYKLQQLDFYAQIC